MLFRQGHAEEKYTTERIFMAFNITRNDAKIRKSGQMMGGVKLRRKCRDLEDYFALVYSVLNKDPWLITDIYNEETKRLTPVFKDNRHDQSISSVAHKVRGGIIGNRILGHT